MKKVFILIFLSLNFNGISQTQADMNEQAYELLHKTDKELNHVYQEILLEYKSDRTFIQNLKKSQLIWIEFRDAELEMKFPNYPDKIYGSIHPICKASYLAELTQVRIETLKKWIIGADEINGCGGSVKLND